MKKYDLIVFIGRFQPFHSGHAAVIRQASEISDNVLILIGSSEQARTIRNPWTYSERAGMIHQSFVNDSNFKANLHTDYILDVYDNSQWLNQVQHKVRDHEYWIIDQFKFKKDNVKTAIIGYTKDAETGSYLSWFPQWDKIEAPDYAGINATQIRESYFSNIAHMFIKDLDGHKEGDKPIDAKVPTTTKVFLENFLNTPEYKVLLKEFEDNVKYRAQFVNLPYPPIFVTVDAVVEQSGHVLLVKRKFTPGKGLWALPGGFLNSSELIIDGFIRELYEETNIKIQKEIILGSIEKSKVFDYPNRSARGRTITHAFHVKLKDNLPLAKVRGDDDAEKAEWVKFSDLQSDMFFDDHYLILKDFLGI